MRLLLLTGVGVVVLAAGLWLTCIGVSASAQAPEYEIDGGQPPGAGSGEAVLDIQDISAIAPGANIDVYEAPNTTFGVLDAYAAIVNDDVAQIISTSWGLCEQVVQQAEPGVLEAENLLFQQAAAQGQRLLHLVLLPLQPPQALEQHHLNIIERVNIRVAQQD